MTKRTVTNQDRFVSTRGTGDWAVATEADECLVNGVPKKFENWATSDQLLGGTSGKTTIAGEPIWTKPGKLGPPSMPVHAGTLGKKSGQPARGEAEAITTSGNLKAEGEPVVRLRDKTHQNRKNTLGEVMPEHKRFNFEDAAGAAGGAHADSGGTRGGSKKAEEAPVVAGDGAFPPSGTVPVEHCNVQAVRATCEHKHRPSKEGLLQVVVPAAAQSHSVILEASVDGPCLAVPDHPHWTMNTGQISPGRLTKVAIQSQTSKPIEWLSGRGFDQLSDRMRKVHVISCGGCADARHQLNVEAYAPARVDLVLDRKNGGDQLAALLETINFVLALFVDGGEMGGKPEGGTGRIDVLNGKASCIVQVKEFTDHRVYVDFDLRFDFKPFFRLSLRLSIADLITQIALYFLTAGWGVGAKAATGSAAAATKAAATGLRANAANLLARAKRLAPPVVARLAKAGKKKAQDWIADGAGWALDGTVESDKLSELLAKRLEYAFKPPADIQLEANTRLDVEGHLARSTPDQPRPVAVVAPVATYKQTVGIAGNAGGIMGGGALQLSFELIVVLSATATARATIGLDDEDRLFVKETVLTSEPVLTVTLCSPFGEFMPEVLKVPKLDLRATFPSTIIFPEPTVSR